MIHGSDVLQKASKGTELLPFLCCFQGQPRHCFTNAANSSVAFLHSLPLGFLPHLCPRSRSMAWTLRQPLTRLDVELIILNFNYRAFPALSVKLEVHNGPF